MGLREWEDEEKRISWEENDDLNSATIAASDDHDSWYNNSVMAMTM